MVKTDRDYEGWVAAETEENRLRQPAIMSRFKTFIQSAAS